MPNFHEKQIRSWNDFYGFVFQLKSVAPHGWIYRGQTKDWPLQTTLERALDDWKIDPKDAYEIEFQTIREFQRRTLDPLFNGIHTDTLFCLSLMQHHGAPTRLLDCSYSPFAAAAFAMEKGPKGSEKMPVVWCFSTKWLDAEAKQKTRHKTKLKQRNADKKRTDATFVPLYHVGPKGWARPKEQFVLPENPLRLTERLTTQQGLFLCPGDLTIRFVDNLKSMTGWHSERNVVKLRLRWTQMRPSILFET